MQGYGTHGLCKYMYIHALCFIGWLTNATQGIVEVQGIYQYVFMQIHMYMLSNQAYIGNGGENDGEAIGDALLVAQNAVTATAHGKHCTCVVLLWAVS